jgi:hypothetical protein
MVREGLRPILANANVGGDLKAKPGEIPIPPAQFKGYPPLKFTKAVAKLIQHAHRFRIGSRHYPLSVKPVEQARHPGKPDTLFDRPINLNRLMI